VANVLVVTTSVRVLHRVHGTATDLRPAVALDTVLVVCAASLQHWLVETTTTGNNANGSTAGVLHPLLGARRQTDLGALLVDILCDDCAVVAGGTSNHATVTRADLAVGDHGTLRHGYAREGVSSDELGSLSAVEELASVCAFDCWHKLLVELVGASIVEVNLSERSATARVVDDVLHDSLEETGALTEVKDAELGSTLAVAVVRLENRSTAFTLASDNATHGKSAVAQPHCRCV